MSNRDSVPDGLQLWRAAGVPVEAGLQDACRPTTVRAIEGAMARAQRSRVQRRWLRGALLAAAVGAAAVATLLVVNLPGPEVVSPAPAIQPVAETRARARTGSAEVTRGVEHHVLTGDRSLVLDDGDVVRVGRDASLLVDLPGHGNSEWSAGTVVDVRHLDEERQGFRLREGHVAVEIPADAPPRRLVVMTPHVDVEVVGTVFDVSVFQEADETVTEVGVQRGKVKLTRAGEVVAQLGAGQTWSSRQVEAVETEDASPERVEPVTRAAPDAPGPSSLREQNRLYRAALDARNAGQDERTVTLLSQLLAEHPGSPLAQEAKVERFRALRRLGRTDEASRAARRYLAEHGDGFAREEAREAALPNREPQH